MSNCDMIFIINANQNYLPPSLFEFLVVNVLTLRITDKESHCNLFTGICMDTKNEK